MTGYCEKCASRVHTSTHGKRCEGCLIAERDEAVRLLRESHEHEADPCAVCEFLSRVGSVKP